MEKALISFLNIKENKTHIEFIKKVIDICFKVENLEKKELYVNIVLTNSKKIKETNKKYRNIDKETDVLSFPMFEKEELKNILEQNKIKIPYVIGDIMVSIKKVELQAKQYNHSFERELGYMIVHGFYHLLGYDHINEKEKSEMRKKEEVILEKLNIIK